MLTACGAPKSTVIDMQWRRKSMLLFWCHWMILCINYNQSYLHTWKSLRGREVRLAPCELAADRASLSLSVLSQPSTSSEKFLSSRWFLLTPRLKAIWGIPSAKRLPQHQNTVPPHLSGLENIFCQFRFKTRQQANRLQCAAFINRCTKTSGAAQATLRLVRKGNRLSAYHVVGVMLYKTLTNAICK